MKKEAAFWDTSALVPLCALEETSNQALALFSQYDPIVWWAAMVELHSAIARKHLAGILSETERAAVLERLANLQNSWDEILPSEELRDLAQTLLYTHPLRAADSLQLAAALVWCRQKPAGRKFVASDLRLGDAAMKAGFTILRP